MLKYLLMKNVKTDSDYKKSQLIMYAITMVLMIATMIALYMTAENLDFAFGIIIGAGGVILVFSVIFLRELLNPVKLHAARIKATDERRKQLEQEALAEEMEVTRQTIISLEKGKYTASLNLAYKLAKYFETTIEDIFFSENEEEDVL